MQPSADNAINKDESEVPEWLDKTFFTKVLKHCEKSQDVKIKSFELKAATAKNDHYASAMFRAICEFYSEDKLKTKSMVLKILPEYAGLKKDILEDSFIFETEIGIYSEVIPKFQAILKSAGDETKLGPTCIFHSLNPKKIIIFEDLVTLGYTPLRGRSASLEEINEAYRKLAKWHAVGFKLISEQSMNFDSYRHGILTIKSFQDSNVFKKGILFFIEMLESHEDLKEYKPYFDELYKSNVVQHAVASYEEFWKTPQAEAYYVLCHGDFHNKNFMLKRNANTGELDDLMLLDYQMSYVGPIVNDIIYSIYMLLDSEHRINHLDKLLHSYFVHFQKTLQRIGYRGPMPKILEFRKQMMRHKSLSIFLLTTYLPLWYAFKESDFEPDELDKSDDRHRQLYTNKNYLHDVRKLLPKLLYQGYLEEDS